MFTLFIYIPGTITMAAISESSYQFFGVYSHIVPCCVSTSLMPPMLWLVALPFMRHRPTLLPFIYAWPATRSYLFSTVCRKKTPLVACKIYIFLTFAY